MTWVPLLLTDPSPNLRILVLTELLNRAHHDEEVKELMELREKDPVVSSLLKLQRKDGSWDINKIGTFAPGGNLQTTSQALVRFGYLGFNEEFPAVKKAVEYIFSKQLKDGSWPLPQSKYDMQPLQTAVPLEGIAACGYATDKRAEEAYDWLMKKKLEDGSWPTGIASGVFGGVGGYRRIAHSRWGCRSNTIAVLNCLSYHPKRCKSPEARRALDLILGCEAKEKYNLGFVISRLIGLEKSRGWMTYYPKLDPAHVLKLCWKLGASLDDDRVSDLIEFVLKEQGEYGLWECSSHPQASRWLTFDLLRSLSNLEKNKEWVSFEPRTPFQAYYRKKKRY